MLERLLKWLGLRPKSPASPSATPPRKTARQVSAPPPPATPTSAPPQRQPRKQAVAERRSRRFVTAPVARSKERLIVAIDFGTSNTKLSYRVHGSPTVNVVMPDEVAPGRPPVCWPSTIAVDKGQVYFGLDALRRPGADLMIPSIKMCVAHELGALDDKKGHLRSAYDLGPTAAEAHVLATLYLAWALSRVHERLAGEQSALPEDITYNMGAPLDMLTFNPNLRETFELCLLRAVTLVDAVHQGLDAGRAVELYQAAMERFPALPEESARHAFVIPETQAAISGAVLSNRLDDGHYVVIDVGAGTTDVAAFWYSRKGKRFVSYYSARTEAKASDDLDLAIARHVMSVCSQVGEDDLGALIEQIRAAKQVSTEGQIELKQLITIGGAEVSRLVAEVISEITRNFRGTWWEAYCQFSRKQTWNPLHVVLIGGGVRLPQVSAALGRSPSPLHVESVELHRLELTERMVDCRTGRSASLAGCGDMLTVLNGLSHHYATIPRWYDPVPYKPPEKVKGNVPDIVDKWW